MLRKRQRKVDEAGRERPSCANVQMASDKNDRPERTNVLRQGDPREQKVVCQDLLAENANLFVICESDENKVQAKIAGTPAVSMRVGRNG